MSELLVTDSTEVFYTDSTASSQKGLSYTYAVKAVNTSYDISAFSERLNIAAPSKVKLTTPINVNARIIDSNVVVFWDNKSDRNALGYRVFKRIKKEGTANASQFERVNEAPLSAQVNYYKDVLAADGVVYEYAVQSLSVNKQESALSAPVEVGLSSKRLLPATGLRVTGKGKSAFLSWDSSEQSDLTGYKIYRLNGSDKALLATIDKSAGFYEDSTPLTGQLNSYIITCASKSKESAPSVAVSIRMK